MTKEPYYCLFYNVENLFPPDENGETISGFSLWDKKRYQHKLNNLCKVFHYVERENKGINPIIIGLAEVATDSVLHDLCNLWGQKDYRYVHYNSLDERGIDTAFIYDQTRATLIGSQSISFVFDTEEMELENYDTTRDILECEMEIDGNKTFVLVVHLPSKREKNINENKRKLIVQKLNERCIQIIQQHPTASFVLMGDFNSNPIEQTLTDITSSKTVTWINPFLELYNQGQYTSYFHQKGMLFDQILTSSNIENSNAQVINPFFLRLKSRKWNFLPFRTFVGRRYQGGYSDHFPISLHFGWKNNNL